MTTLLQIDASPRIQRSHSRRMAREFVQAWAAANPGAKVINRDVAARPPAFPSEGWIAAAYGFPGGTPEALAESDALIAELLSADRLVLSTPMHNFNVSACLKVYIDNIVRIGKTFGANEKGYFPLVKGKKLLVIYACGGIYSGESPYKPYNLLEPVLRTEFGFIGITDITFVPVEGMNLGDELREKGLAAARAQLRSLAGSW